MICEIIRGGGGNWLGGERMGRPTFPRGKNGPAHSFPGEKTDWGKFRPVTTAPKFGYSSSFWM